MNNISIALKLLAGAAASFFNGFNFDINRVEVNQPSKQVISQLQKFESSFIYPFSSNEEFTIKHGIKGDYFSFFKKLGEPYYYVVTSKTDRDVKKIVNGKHVIVKQKEGEVAAAVCCVLRNIKDRTGKHQEAWYICDLKVNEKYQGEHLPMIITQKIAFSRFKQCPRGFAICMNPTVGDPKAARIFKKHGPIMGINTQTLNLYTLSGQQVKQHQDNIQIILVKHGYMKSNMKLGVVSTSGRKDYEIINKTTGEVRSWNLQHIVPSTNEFTLQEDANYMICSVEGSKLDNDFKKILGLPSSTAQILSYGMNGFDFNFLTSAEI